MKTKLVLALLMTGALLLTTACSATTADAVNTVSQDAAASTIAASEPVAAAAAVSQKEARPEKIDDQSMITGKITAVSGDTITLAEAVTQEPSNKDERTPGGGTPPADGSAPERPARENSEASSDAEPPSGMPGGGRGQGREMNMEFSDETATYTFAGAVAVTKGMGDNAQTITLDDLAAGDIVRIELNDNSQITAILLMDMDGNGQPPEKLQGESSLSK